MSKQITPAELAEIVTTLLTAPEQAGELEERRAFAAFFTEVAEVVCNHCGGAVHKLADDDADGWLVGIHGNDCLPEGGGIWAKYDPEGALFDDVEADDVEASPQACTHCGNEVSEVVGCPSGAELCPDCFNQGGEAEAEMPSVTSVVPVKHWGCYNVDGTVFTHQIDITDVRRTEGQVYVTVGSPEGHLDEEMISATFEINTDPRFGIEQVGSVHVPCVHIHFDGDNLAFSLFKIGEKILLRPETDVKIEHFTHRTGRFSESFYWVE